MIELGENKRTSFSFFPLDFCRVFFSHFVGELSKGEVGDEDDGDASPLAKLFAHFAANVE